MDRAERISRAIKHHDPMLYCERSEEGKLCVYRKSTRVETYHLDDTTVLHFVRSAPHFVFSLTENWKFASPAVDWGIEPVMARLKAIDLWNRDLFSEIEANEERISASNEREMKNNVESFLKDFRTQFARTFNDVNTSSMAKKDLRRDNEKRIHQ